MKSPFLLVNVVIAISAGVLVLAGTFIPGLDFLRDLLLRWAVILSGFALLVGALNLLSVHLGKVRTAGARGAYSAVLILAFLATVLVVGVSGPAGSWSVWLFQNIQLPVEGTLMAILAVTLAYASMRLLRRRADWVSVVFVLTVLLVLLGSVPLYSAGEIPALSGLRAWLAHVPAIGGARGILLGVALGIIATGLRILLGVDRPYGS